MKKYMSYLCLPAAAFVLCCCADGQQPKETLKEALDGKFYIGAALNAAEFYGVDPRATKTITTQFNAIVGENVMKSMFLQPAEGQFFFVDADRLVEFGQQNGMLITGHTLIWHSQAPRWLFVDENGDDVSPEVLTERMRSHIHTVVGRYKGRVKGWDVVNEAIEDNGEWRQSKFYRILGEDFIRLAFQFAHEADPEAELYYNDYSMALPGRREKVIELVKSLQQQGVRIDGIGMQGHLGMDGPSVAEFEKSLLAFSELGMKVMITELDLSALPNPWENLGANISDTAGYEARMNPYTDGLPAEVEKEWEERYLDFFRLFLKHQDKISRVTLWGVSDLTSWKNGFPIRGRTDYPLLFDRNYQPKPIVERIVQEAKHY